MVVFRGGLELDQRFPVIAAFSRQRAFSLAASRARQLVGNRRLELVTRSDGRNEWWRVGGLSLRIVDPF
ncbi:MAG: hypothetical protein NXH88_04635 [Hyphomonas sp.]|nr:hypothetical protein [Hyphomonas sp.]